jgi:hypothetical protein
MFDSYQKNCVVVIDNLFLLVFISLRIDSFDKKGNVISQIIFAVQMSIQHQTMTCIFSETVNDFKTHFMI